MYQKWFASCVSSPSCLFYIATNGAEAQVGQIRYDITDDTAVGVAELGQGSGRRLGPALMWRGSESCFADSSVRLIRAYVKPDKQASIRAFSKAGFTDAGAVEMFNTIMRQFVMSRECNF